MTFRFLSLPSNFPISYPLPPDILAIYTFVFPFVSPLPGRHIPRHPEVRVLVYGAGDEAGHVLSIPEYEGE